MHRFNDCDYLSWGNYPKQAPAEMQKPQSSADVASAVQFADHSVLPRGMGRSYGDVCLNENGCLISTVSLDKFIKFDADSGLLTCEAGVTLDEILRIFVPRGWFLRVTPGTRFVTVGGAIANDVHGKNHHRTGTFGHYVTQFELMRSDGNRFLCNQHENTGWFRATIGGLGLTGIILWATIRLIRITGPYMQVEYEKFASLQEFFNLSQHASKKFEYTVAWLDCSKTQAKLGRGIFMCANHDPQLESDSRKVVHKDSAWRMIPIHMPSFVLSKPTIRAFNQLYYNLNKKGARRIHYAPFFYPLDSLKYWNRLYGKRGFLQWQCVVPKRDQEQIIGNILRKIIDSSLASFLVVLKEFGDIPSEGMLSFPMQGTTLSLDFPNVGEKLFHLLNTLDIMVREAGGRLYPAKDARMSAETFSASFPALEQFKPFVDSKFSSSFYRRVI